MRPYTISERLYELLTLNNEKAVDMSHKTNIPKSSLSLYLSGKREPRADVLTKIALTYNVNETWLMGYDMPMERPSISWNPETQEIVEDKHYYLEDEARNIADFLLNNPEYQVLFDASRKVKADDIKKAVRALGIFTEE